MYSERTFWDAFCKNDKYFCMWNKLLIFFFFEKMQNVYILLDKYIYTKIYDGMLIRSPNKNIYIYIFWNKDLKIRTYVVEIFFLKYIL